jgi:gamma-glutamylcyclotransferase (GGCT)/AIG2-like uncharacterized protein YtfP
MSDVWAYYFAYGHNTNKREMHKRIPEAVDHGPAVLFKHRLRLTRFADVCKDPTTNVVGVLWKIFESSLKKLDEIEEVFLNRPCSTFHGCKKVTINTAFQKNNSKKTKSMSRS